MLFRSHTYTLVGPLCTAIDTLATKLELPALECGDVLAIESSGAYGLSASPMAFISHPEPREVLVSDVAGSVRTIDISERLRVCPFDEQTIENGTGWSADGE